MKKNQHSQCPTIIWMLLVSDSNEENCREIRTKNAQFGLNAIQVPTGRNSIFDRGKKVPLLFFVWEKVCRVQWPKNRPKNGAMHMGNFFEKKNCPKMWNRNESRYASFKFSPSASRQLQANFLFIPDSLRAFLILLSLPVAVSPSRPIGLSLSFPFLFTHSFYCFLSFPRHSTHTRPWIPTHTKHKRTHVWQTQVQTQWGAVI